MAGFSAGPMTGSPEISAGNSGKRYFLSTRAAELVERPGPPHGKGLPASKTNSEESKAERRNETNS